MPFNANEYLYKQFKQETAPLERGYRAERDAAMMATLAKYKANRPERLPMAVQGALNQEMQRIRSKWVGKKDQIMSRYQPKLQAMQEVDRMVQGGLLSGDPKLIKAKMVLPPEVYSQMEPEKKADPRERYRDLESELKMIESRMGREFDVIAAGTPIAGSGKRRMAFDLEEQRRVGPEVQVRTGQISYDDDGEEVYETRAANKQERERWAMLEARRQRVKRLQQEVGTEMLGASRLRRSVLPKDKGSGTFGDKALSSVSVPKAQPQEIRVRQKSTGQTGMIPVNEFNAEEYERIQ